MTTQELVARLIELINTGQNTLAQEELYAENVVSFEQDGSRTEGIETVMAHTKAMVASVSEWHGGGVTKAYVGSDTAILEIAMDYTPKEGDRITASELGYYRFEDGKVVEERFYMMPMAF